MSSAPPVPARRRATRESRSPIWPALVAIAVSAAALQLAGGGGAPVRPAADGVGAPVRVDRTLVCPGGLPAARVDSGVAGPVAARSQKVSSSPLGEEEPRPRKVLTQAGEGVGAFATQVARRGPWLALTPCPEARADWWFVGAGASQTHSSTLSIANPRDGDAVIDVDVYGPKGPVTSPGTRGMFVRHGDTLRLDLAEVAPSNGDLAVHVTASRGLVSVAAADTFSPDTVGKPVREWITPQPTAARSLTLTGLPGKLDSATLLLANPGDVEALAEVQVIGSEGTFSPPENGTVRVPPGAVLPVEVKSVFNGKPLAFTVTSGHDLVATIRSVVGGDEVYAGAAGLPADGAALGVPADVAARLIVSSTGAAGTARIVTFAASGKRLGSEDVTVAATTTVSVDLPKGARQVVFSSGSPDVVAALVVAGSPGIGAAVFDAAVRAARTPEVRPY